MSPAKLVAVTREYISLTANVLMIYGCGILENSKCMVYPLIKEVFDLQETTGRIPLHLETRWRMCRDRRRH
jgi:hypothetical protein